MSEFLSMTAVGLLAAISPGPDFALVARNAMVGSRRDGLLTAAGVALGMLVHATYTVLGIGLLIQNVPSLFKALQLAGAGYLIFIGVRGVIGSGRPMVRHAVEPRGRGWQALREGVLCNVLNPKTMVFFISIFSLILPCDVSVVRRAAYGLEIAALHLIWFACLTILINQPGFKQRLLGAQTLIERILGSVLAGLGARLVFMTFG